MPFLDTWSIWTTWVFPPIARGIAHRRSVTFLTKWCRPAGWDFNVALNFVSRLPTKANSCCIMCSSHTSKLLDEHVWYYAFFFFVKNVMQSLKFLLSPSACASQGKSRLTFLFFTFVCLCTVYMYWSGAAWVALRCLTQEPCSGFRTCFVLQFMYTDKQNW